MYQYDNCNELTTHDLTIDDYFTQDSNEDSISQEDLNHNPRTENNSNTVSKEAIVIMSGRPETTVDNVYHKGVPEPNCGSWNSRQYDQS